MFIFSNLGTFYRTWCALRNRDSWSSRDRTWTTSFDPIAKTFSRRRQVSILFYASTCVHCFIRGSSYTVLCDYHACVVLYEHVLILLCASKYFTLLYTSTYLHKWLQSMYTRVHSGINGLIARFRSCFRPQNQQSNNSATATTTATAAIAASTTATTTAAAAGDESSWKSRSEQGPKQPVIAQLSFRTILECLERSQHHIKTIVSRIPHTSSKLVHW